MNILFKSFVCDIQIFVGFSSYSYIFVDICYIFIIVYLPYSYLQLLFYFDNYKLYEMLSSISS